MIRQKFDVTQDIYGSCGCSVTNRRRFYFSRISVSSDQLQALSHMSEKFYVCSKFSDAVFTLNVMLRMTSTVYFAVSYITLHYERIENQHKLDRKKDYTQCLKTRYHQAPLSQRHVAFNSEWVSSFLTAHQHIIGYFSALQWCEYCDKIVEI